MTRIEAAIMAEVTAEVVEARVGGTDAKLGLWKRVKEWLSHRK
jgi:hypothetical protein